jgi:hypothetical protein
MSKILYPATVINNQDPMMLGRVRAYPFDQNVESVLEGYNFQEGKDEFTEKDPFVVLPLLPMFISQVPAVGERISVILQNSERRFQDAYYVQGAYSSPMTLKFENGQASAKNTSLGYRIKTNLALKDKSGQIIKPTQTFGVFPELSDVSILGRGTSDVIVKPDSVLIRAGKTLNLNPKTRPLANEKRAYIQVSSFDTKFVELKSQDLITTNVVNEQTNYLIEWNVYNLDNAQNAFTGDIILYKLRPSQKTLTDNINYETDLNDSRFVIDSQQFFGLSSENVIQSINSFINQVNEGSTTNGVTLGNDRFPFVYRPSSTVREILKPGSNVDDPVVFSNAAKFIGGITLNPGQGPKGYSFALVSSKGVIGKPFKISVETITPKTVEASFGTFMMSAADTLVMMSHRTGNIVFDPKLSPNPNTMMGITQQQLQQNVLPNTYAMVRGDILFDYLEKISSFLQNHVHSHANLPPSSLTWAGDKKSDLFSFPWRFRALNENIRIN